MAENSQHSASPSRKRPAPDDSSHDLQRTPAKDPSGSPHSSDLSTPRTVESPQESPLPASNAALKQTSPAPSSSGSVLADRPALIGTPVPGSTSAKRRKLTPQEKEQRRLEDEAKAKAREDKRAKKEEEAKQKEEAKKIKAEEKRIKDEKIRKENEEKEEKKRERELKKQQKEEEQRKKGLEKQQKERAQLKIGSFFTKNANSTSSAGPASTLAADQNSRRNSVSLEPAGSPNSASTSPSPHKKPQLSDYERTFLPFEPLSHSTVAPQNWFWADQSDTDREATIRKLDRVVGPEAEEAKQEVLSALEKRDFSALLSVPSALRGRRGEQFPPVRDLMAHLDGSSAEPIDLTGELPKQEMRQPLEILKTIPMKYLHFGEDVRPAYCGTFTKVQSERESRKLARNPFSRTLPEANYDYDSEVEWEEPEGEDLDADDEEDIESQEGEDDLEGFLDDDDDAAQSKRRLITGDLEPICSGLCWEDPKGVLYKANGLTDPVVNFSGYKMGVLLEPQPVTIDPFSTAYWQCNPTPLPSAGKDSLGLMNPPRLPLHVRPDGMVNGANVGGAKVPSAKTANGISAPPKPPKRLIPPEIMAEFKEAICGSDLTKIALIEALKKRFPKVPKDAIANTLSIVASRVGAKAQEKRWALIET